MLAAITKSGLITGLIGLFIMCVIWMSGFHAPLWALAFWPSQLVGLGTDGVQWLPEIAIQFFLYAVLGCMVGVFANIKRSEA